MIENALILWPQSRWITIRQWNLIAIVREVGKICRISMKRWILRQMKNNSEGSMVQLIGWLWKMLSNGSGLWLRATAHANLVVVVCWLPWRKSRLTRRKDMWMLKVNFNESEEAKRRLEWEIRATSIVCEDNATHNWITRSPLRNP